MSPAELAEYYPPDYWGESEPKAEWIRSSQAEKTAFLRHCGLTGGRILDVGCGTGLFLRALAPKDWERFGVETGAPAAEIAGRHLGGDHVHAGELVGAPFPGSFFDVVTFWSVLEHTNDPRGQLEKAHHILKPGGSIVIQLPNASCYQARWFGGDWFALDAPRHRYHFDRKTLGRLLAETGFDVYRTTLFSKTHNSHALRQSLKARLRRRGALAGRTLFALSIPWIKPFDGLMTLADEGATLTVAARQV